MKFVFKKCTFHVKFRLMGFYMNRCGNQYFFHYHSTEQNLNSTCPMGKGKSSFEQNEEETISTIQ